jgi:hypothetical protein
MEAAPGTPVAFRERIGSEVAHWKDVVDRAGIRPGH